MRERTSCFQGISNHSPLHSSSSLSRVAPMQRGDDSADMMRGHDERRRSICVWWCWMKMMPCGRRCACCWRMRAITCSKRPTRPPRWRRCAPVRSPAWRCSTCHRAGRHEAPFFTRVAADPALVARHAYVCMTTSVPRLDPALRRQLAAYCVPVLAKPFDVDMLLRTLARAALHLPRPHMLVRCCLDVAAGGVVPAFSL